MFDVIAIGDCMIDNYFNISDAHLSCSLNKEKCELCLNYASKIASQSYYCIVAGNCTNVSIGCSRLKLKTAFYSNIGSDTNGEKIIKKLKDEKVNTNYFVINKEMDSNVAAIINFQGEKTDIVYHQPWTYILPDLDQTKWIYFSSLSSSFVNSNIISQIENYLERTGSQFAYNPGTFQLKANVKKNRKLLSLTSLFIVNLQEAELILDIPFGGKEIIKQILTTLSDLGPKKVIITNGSDGSYGYDGISFYKLPIFPAKLVEMTGAGDAYTTGVVAALFDGQDLSAAMRWGAANGASVVEQVGPQAGLLTFIQMQEQLRKSAKIITQKM